MGLPAFLKPAVELGEPTIPSLPPAVEQRCSQLWDVARAAWSSRPAEESAAEQGALVPTFELMFEVTRALVGHSHAALRALVNEGLRRVLREQRATAEDDRAFALRQMEQAIEHYGLVVETIAKSAGLDDIIDDLIDAVAEPKEELPPELRPLYRAHGALLMAFEGMTSGTPEEFRYWARRAVERWRAVVGTLPELTALVRGAGAHVRARSAWDAWTDEDRSTEKASWKALR